MLREIWLWRVKLGHFAPTGVEVKVMGHGHSAQWATDFCGFPDAKRLLLYFAAWAGVEAGNSRVYLKIKKKRGEENPVFPVMSELINQKQSNGKNSEPQVPQES